METMLECSHFNDRGHMIGCFTTVTPCLQEMLTYGTIFPAVQIKNKTLTVLFHIFTYLKTNDNALDSIALNMGN